MSNKLEREGGPAFPQEYTCAWAGLTMRDYFAAKAMQSLVTMTGTDEADDEMARLGLGIGETDKFVAKCAYDYADAMLEARDK